MSKKSSSSSSSSKPTPRESKEEKKIMSVSKIQAKGKRGTVPSLPPTIQVTPPVACTYRYKVTTAGLYPVTVASVVGAIGGICTVANSKINSWSASFRIRRVTVWPPLDSSFAPVGLFWAVGPTGTVADGEKDGSIPAGITSTKPTVFTPPAMTLCGFWLETADPSANLFELDVPAGAIVDFDVTYRLSNVYPSYQQSITSGTLGTVYYLALDGPGSNKIVPTLLPTTS